MPRLYPLLLLALLPAFLAQQGSSATGSQYYAIYLYNISARRDVILVEKLLLRGSRLYVPISRMMTDLEELHLSYTITKSNTLELSRGPVTLSQGRAYERMHYPPAIMIEGKPFKSFFLPPNSDNPLEAYVDLEAFVNMLGGTCFFNQRTQVIHINPVHLSEGKKSSAQGSSTCLDWVHWFNQSKNASGYQARGVREALALKPTCNEKDEMVSRVSGKAIVFTMPPCSGVPLPPESIEAWQEELLSLQKRYEVVVQTCPPIP